MRNTEKNGDAQPGVRETGAGDVSAKKNGDKNGEIAAADDTSQKATAARNPENFPESRALDALRAFGAIALALVFHHLYYVGDNSVFFSAVPNVFPLAQIFKAMRMYGEYIVDLMYCVSGFTLCLAYKNRIADGSVRAGSFALRRAARLYPLYLITLLASAAMSLAAALIGSRVLSGQVYDAADSVKSFLLSIFFAQDFWSTRSTAFNDPAWTLSFYLLIYIVFYLVARRAKGRASVLRFAVCTVIGAAMVIFAPYDTPFFNYETGRALAGFFAGCLSFELHRVLSRARRGVRMGAVIAAFSIVSALLYTLVFHANLRYTDAFILAMRLVFFPSVLIFVLNIPLLARFLSLRFFRWLGGLSFSMYLWHLPIVTLMKLFIFAASGERKMLEWTISPAFYYCWVGGTFLVSHLSHYYFERAAQRCILSAFSKSAPAERTPRRLPRAVLFAAAAVCIIATPAVLSRVVAAETSFEAIERDGSVLFINRPDGYSIELPAGFTADRSRSADITRYISAESDVTISREWSPYDDVDEYIAYYLNRFATDEVWRASNNIDALIDTTESVGAHLCRVISLRVNDLPEPLPCIYTYVTINAEGKTFLRLMFRSRSESDDWRHAVETLEFFTPFGPRMSELDPTLTLPDTWTPETRSFYERLQARQSPEFGVFERSRETLDALEAAIEYKFPVILDYLHLNSAFPQEYYDGIYDSGRALELTLQITDSNNLNLLGRSPMLDIYRGNEAVLERVREFARGVKRLGHPVLFRLNNEMNTDWCSYSGIINLSDPEIYTAVWRTVYDIFREEGADNAIWVWNPNNNSYPPCRWNGVMSYYPGDEYVQMLGVTGYNTGTYYADLYAEVWREFREIYDDIQRKYEGTFEDFPWIITEFASSGFGGDKAKWIDGMFENLERYEQIKLAVWFNADDVDLREGPDSETVARSYKLKEPSALEALRRGLSGIG